MPLPPTAQTRRTARIHNGKGTAPGKTFSRAQLMDEFWGIESETSLRAVDVYITKLRDKFSACDGFEIRTVRGLGYKAVLL